MDLAEFKNLEPEPKGLPGVWPGQGTWAAGIKPFEYFQAIKILGKDDTTYYIVQINARRCTGELRCQALSQLNAWPGKMHWS